MSPEHEDAVIDHDVVAEEDLLAVESAPAASQHHSLKYHLLGPSLTKSGQDNVDQQKVG